MLVMNRYSAVLLVFIAMCLLAAALTTFGQGTEPEPPAGCGPPPPEPEEPMPTFGITYTMAPRVTGEVCNDNFCVSESANWQRFTDVGSVWRVSETNVVHDDLNGTITTMHDCTGVSDICAADGTRFSPNGLLVAYHVLSAPPTATKWGVRVPNGGPMLSKADGVWEFDAQNSDIWIYSVLTGHKWKVNLPGRSRDPEWCGPNCLMVANDSQGTFAPRSINGTDKTNFYKFPSAHIKRVELNAAGQPAQVTNLTPDCVFSLAPFMLSSGRFGYSCFSGWSDHPETSAHPAYKDMGSTPQNFWKIQTKELDGSDPRTILNGHGTWPIDAYSYIQDWVDPLRMSERTSIVQSPRPCQETRVGRMKCGSYYRAQYAGTIIGSILRGDAGEGTLYSSKVLEFLYSSNMEGSGRYMDPDIYNATPYAPSQDFQSPNMEKDPPYRVAGRAQNPTAWVGDHPGFLYAHCRGLCYTAAKPELLNYEALGGEPLAKWEIRLAAGQRVSNPFDPKQSKVIACASMDDHCINPDVGDTYENIMGVPFPETKTPKDEGKCYVAVVDAREGDLENIPGNTGYGNGDSASIRVKFQGNALDPIAVKTLAYNFRLDYTQDWTTTATDVGFPSRISQRIRLKPDGSLFSEVLCDTPFQHFLESETGLTLAAGIDRLHVPRGTVMVCHGCHADSIETRAEFSGTARQRFTQTLAYLTIPLDQRPY